MLPLAHPYALKTLIACDDGTRRAYGSLPALLAECPDCKNYRIGFRIIDERTGGIADGTEGWYDDAQQALGAFLDTQKSSPDGLPPGVFKMLSLDAECICKATQNLLEQECSAWTDHETSLSVTRDWESGEQRGWFVQIGDDTENVPEDLAGALSLAKECGCRMLHLDDNGSRMDEKPSPDSVMSLCSDYVCESTAALLNDGTEVGPFGTDPFTLFGIIVRQASGLDSNREWYVSMVPNGPKDAGRMPADLRACLEFMKSSGCSILRLSPDGCKNGCFDEILDGYRKKAKHA